MSKLKRILCPTDLSENSQKAVAMTLSMALKYEAGAFFLYVTDRPARNTYDKNATANQEMDAIDEDERVIREDVARAIEFLVKDGEVEFPSDRLMYRVASGNVAEAIIQASEDAQVEMIVMGSHGRTSIKEFLLGSVAERVLKRATCNVMVVKPDGFPYLRD